MASLARGIRWPALGAAIDLVYPPQCVSCREAMDRETSDRRFCDACWNSLDLFSHPYCNRCGTSLSRPDRNDCRTCEEQRFRFDRVVRLGPYEQPLREYVLRMKHVAEEPLSLGIGGLLAEACCRELSSWQPELVVPIPMFWRRRIVRRTSSADILATTVGKRLRTPVSLRALVRRRNTQPQGDLSPRERRANVRDAFRLRRPKLVADRRVLLVDDVLTTGATLNEVARVLEKAGAREIAVAVAARTEGTNL